jgi:hypothetical protein
LPVKVGDGSLSNQMEKSRRMRILEKGGIDPKGEAIKKASEG